METVVQRVAHLRRLLRAEKRRDREAGRALQRYNLPHLGICLACEAVHESPTAWADNELTDCGRCHAERTVCRP
jgi:hypothetical protein